MTERWRKEMHRAVERRRMRQQRQRWRDAETTTLDHDSLPPRLPRDQRELRAMGVVGAWQRPLLYD